MRLRFICITAVIVLVCLNWFSKAMALDVSKLDEASKAELLKKFAATKANETPGNSYQTPDIYENDSSATVGVPVGDTGTVDREVRHGEQSSRELVRHERTGESQLTEFTDLAPFGAELFRGPNEEAPPNDIASASDYILGPGDNLVVSMWGRVENEYALTIDREGKLFVPKVGEVIAWGKTLEEFEDDLKRKLTSVYSEFELSVSLGKIRSIRIYVTGEARRPGAYTVSSLTSLLNALYLAGGPTERGSMRKVRLMRNGGIIAELDLYRFLLHGDNSSDVRLESGDAIFIPIVGSRVAIRGKVRREAIYELKGEQTALDLLALAGDAEPDAYLGRVMLERIAGRDEWEVLDLNLSVSIPETADNIELFDGDRLTVFSVFEEKRNMVAVFGLVKHPGYFERNDSTRVSDLLKRAKLQPYDVNYDRANLYRRHSDWRMEIIAVDVSQIQNGSEQDDILMQDGDSLHIYSMADVAWDRYVYIEGEVKQPGRYPHYDNMTIEDLVFLAGSFDRGASMLRTELARIDSVGAVSLIDVDIRGTEGRALLLQEDDRVYVRRIPQWQLHRTVLLEGEVQYPGEYVLSERDETLYGLVQRAGGLTDLAFPLGTIFERRSIGENLERLKIPSLLEKSSPIERDSLGNIRRLALFEYDAQAMNRIVLDMNELVSSNGARGDIVLEPGDRIFVPPRPSGICVLGAVGSNGTIGFRENEKVKYYVRRAGNFTRQADKDGLRLIKANGEVFSGGGTSKRYAEMGDVIVVPTKIHRDRNWGNTLTKVLTTTTGVLTSVLIISKL
ncbi:MAG: hypothetical protein DRP45_04380 [Candidatus Zixiibacteriota bacterium]|nr:MAG: hypothetical protein DRP45_04380 [candidate division Zixibacteria bacterium]